MNLLPSSLPITPNYLEIQPPLRPEPPNSTGSKSRGGGSLTTPQNSSSVLESPSTVPGSPSAQAEPFPLSAKFPGTIPHTHRPRP